jgi:hypothetical protein
MSSFCSQFLNDLAHFSVSDQCDFHNTNLRDFICTDIENGP